MAMAKFLALSIMITLVAICMLQEPTLALQGRHGSNDYFLQNHGHGNLHQSQCKQECDRRCSKTKHRKPRCMSFCEPCCAKCRCVPPGTSGNKEKCPCYNNWKTKEGGPKCP